MNPVSELAFFTQLIRVGSLAGTARELYAMFRHGADEAEKGGSAMLALAGL